MSLPSNDNDSTFIMVHPTICVDICLCVDCSGSMTRMFKETVKGVKGFIKEQQDTAKETEIDTYLTIKTFADNANVIPGFDNENIKNVDSFESKYLNPRGGTRLIDTAVEALLEQNRRYDLWNSKECNKNFKMNRIFALLTDGQDNNSRLYSQSDMNHYINKFRTSGVTCIFLGANQDAIEQGNNYGFSRGHSMTYSQTNECAENTFRCLSECVSSACKGETHTEFNELQRSASCNIRFNETKKIDYGESLRRC